MIATSLLSLALLGLAGMLLDAHRRDWREAQAAGGDARSRRFAAARRVRRTTATAAIAVVGVLVALWPVTPRAPLGVTLYLAALLSLATLIFLLGVSDAVASGRFYREENRRRLASHLRELAELVEAERGRREAAPETGNANA